MKTFVAPLAVCEGNQEVIHKGQWRGVVMFPLFAWTCGFATNRDAGDLKRHRAQYDHTVMYAQTTHTVIRTYSGVRF